MQITGKTIRTMCVLAGLTVLAAASSATMLPLDAQIQIDRALNSPTLTVRYSGANAAIVELRINGESIGTRSVTAAKDAGETNFNIDLNSLKDGDNVVEIRLFDRTGKLVGSDKTNISTDQSNRGPVYLKTPKVGATIQGPVEISLGFGKDLKNVYVSFFVDNDFKKMTNYPPYSFNWDTALETNGWHEVEAWVIDDTSTTYKTRKTRVFVDNPGGRTDRVGVSQEAAPKTNPIRQSVVGNEASVKAINVKSSAKAVGASGNGQAPVISGTPVANRVQPKAIGAMSGTKSMAKANVLATGAKNMTPGLRLAPPEQIVKKSTTLPAVVKNAAPTMVAMATKVDTSVKTVKAPPAVVMNTVNTTVGMMKITKGSRLPNLGTFAVVLNSQFVEFDVNPRVDEGVPMTPFRHLLEKAGGTVKWENLSKSLKADAEGKKIYLQIGELNALVNDLSVSLERPAYLERGRTIVPLSFLRDVLNVEIEFDKETGHVLITSIKK
ncbi:MAG: stalk domain-containing protein [Fimbriimonas sp.]